MSKFLILFISISFGFNNISPNEMLLKLQKEKNTNFIKTYNHQEIKTLKKHLVTYNDSLVKQNKESKPYLFRNSSTLARSNNYCDYIKNDSIIKLYKDIVFNNSNCGFYTPVYTQQWKNKIIVYVDKSIPKKTRKDFRRFFEQLNTIEHLQIDFTKNKEKANYLIKDTSKDLLAGMDLYTKNESYPYSHVTYNLLTDTNSKLFGGTLLINSAALKDKTLLLPKLKQLFYISLGQFTIDRNVKKNSLLSYNYYNKDTISKTDILLLKLHYIKLHNKPMSCIGYNKFIKELQLTCLNE